MQVNQSLSESKIGDNGEFYQNSEDANQLEDAGYLTTCRGNCTVAR